MNAQIGLQVAAVYHLLAGAVFFLAPALALRSVGMAPEVYQWSIHVLAFRLVGLLSTCAGAGAWLAARDVQRNTDLLRVLLVAKAGGALVLLYYAVRDYTVRGEFTLLLFLAALLHDLIWIPVFAAGLRRRRVAG